MINTVRINADVQDRLDAASVRSWTINQFLIIAKTYNEAMAYYRSYCLNEHE